MGMIVNFFGWGGVVLKVMMDNVRKYGYEDRIIIFMNIELRSIDEFDWIESIIK